MRLRSASGFTLIEIMVAVGILTVVVAGVMESFVVQNRAYTVVDQTTETQQNLRAVAHLIERDVRMSGFMVPEGAVACGVDETNSSDTLYVTDPDPIDPTGQGRADLGSEITMGYTGGTGLRTLTLSEMSVDGIPFYDTDGNGGADADFRDGGGVILVDRSDPTRGTACGTVELGGVNPGAKTIRVDFQAGINAAGAGDLLLIPAHKYTVDNSGSLSRDGTPIVSDVDDLQVAYFVDANEDGDVDPLEYLSDSPTGTAYSSSGTDHSEVREIRVNLVLRSRTTDRDFTDGTMQATENRAPAGVADGFRRRVLTSTIKPRNVGFRGADNAG